MRAQRFSNALNRAMLGLASLTTHGASSSACHYERAAERGRADAPATLPQAHGAATAAQRQTRAGRALGR